MVALYWDDRATAALRAYDRFSVRLDVDYRVQASPATVVLAKSIATTGDRRGAVAPTGHIRPAEVTGLLP